MDIESILSRAVDALSSLPSVSGIVLGGSRATGTASESADIDIGVYYEAFDAEGLNRAASRIDDEKRSGLIGPEGSWGNWVNCGGWLITEGIHTDIICRDINRVTSVIEECGRGSFTNNYQPGHPHSYVSAMYMGELAVSKVLYARDRAFLELKESAESYPDALSRSLIGFFMFEAEFSLNFAKKSKEDESYLSGHLYRSASSLNQVIFALNQEYCINEKKAAKRIDGFKKRPENYSKRLNSVFASGSSAEKCRVLESLIDDVKKIAV